MYLTRGFKHTYTLRKHKSNHEGKYVCSVCNKRYGLPSSLKRHMQVHSKDRDKKRHKCGYCEKSLCSASSLAAHISKWYSKWCFREKVFSHIEHLYGLTPEWSLSCVRMCVFWENVLPHVAQLYGLSCVCERKCTNNDCLCLKGAIWITKFSKETHASSF
jgi:hypothetical protein